MAERNTNDAVGVAVAVLLILAGSILGSLIAVARYFWKVHQP